MKAAAEILRHDRVLLRRWRPEDVDELTTLIDGSLDRLIPWMPWALTHSRDTVVEYLGRSEKEWGTGESYQYAITEAGPGGEPGRPLGSCGTMSRIGPGGWEIGYWVHQDGSGRGLVTLAAAALTRQAFALPGTTHVEVHHDSENLASGAVPRRLGFDEVFRGPDPDPQFEGRTLVIWRIDRDTAERTSWFA